MRKYETIIIIDSLLKAEEIENIVTKYERFISANGGTIEAVEHWGKKRMAYEIKKRQYGYYVLIRFDAHSQMIRQLEREYRLNESLLRFKVFVLDKLALRALAAKPVLKYSPETQVAVEAPAKIAETEESATEIAEAKPISTLDFSEAAEPAEVQENEDKESE